MSYLVDGSGTFQSFFLSGFSSLNRLKTDFFVVVAAFVGVVFLRVLGLT